MEVAILSDVLCEQSADSRCWTVEPHVCPADGTELFEQAVHVQLFIFYNFLQSLTFVIYFIRYAIFFFLIKSISSFQLRAPSSFFGALIIIIIRLTMSVTALPRKRLLFPVAIIRSLRWKYCRKSRITNGFENDLICSFHLVFRNVVSNKSSYVRRTLFFFSYNFVNFTALGVKQLKEICLVLSVPRY